MSFQNNSIWLSNCTGSLTSGDMRYGTSTTIDNKRCHQWLVDSSEQEVLFTKKQAIDLHKGTSVPTVMDGSLWHDGFSSQSTCPPHHPLFNPKPVQYSNISHKNTPSTISAVLDMENKGLENQLGNGSSFCLGGSHEVQNPLFLNDGNRKVKVDEVRIFGNCLPEYMGNSFCAGEEDKEMSTPYQSTRNDIFPIPVYDDTVDENTTLDASFSKANRSFTSVVPASSREGGDSMLTNQYYNGINNDVLSMGQVFSRGNYNVSNLGEQYDKETGNFMSIGTTYSKGHENVFTLDPFYNKVNETFVPMGATCEADRSTAICSPKDSVVVSLGTLYSKENPTVLSMVENAKKGEQTSISFGSLQDDSEKRDHSGSHISKYNVLPTQSSSQNQGALELKENAEQLSANVISVGNEQKNKKQKPKKGSSNNFPSNVKSLLSTGILDGVPVKYVSWSREKNLRGQVKGTGYLCSCQDCNLSKVINAYEFERHAGCKTKHPNNHIYFENGKTIYAVVQELKATSQDMLFEVMQNVTGGPINEKNFSTWKASYKAATRELQRIYGNDNIIVPS